MWNNRRSIYLSIIVCFIVSAILLLLIIFGPMLFKLYMTSYEGLIEGGAALNAIGKVFAWAFYPSALFAAVILCSLLKFLFNIRKGDVFTVQNTRMLKIIYWSCFAIALITFICGFYYLPFMVVAAAGGFVGVLLRVLKNVMESAVELRTENDLTI